MSADQLSSYSKPSSPKTSSNDVYLARFEEFLGSRVDKGILTIEEQDSFIRTSINMASLVLSSFQRCVPDAIGLPAIDMADSWQGSPVVAVAQHVG